MLLYVVAGRSTTIFFDPLTRSLACRKYSLVVSSLVFSEAHSAAKTWSQTCGQLFTVIVFEILLVNIKSSRTTMATYCATYWMAGIFSVSLLYRSVGTISQISRFVLVNRSRMSIAANHKVLTGGSICIHCLDFCEGLRGLQILQLNAMLCVVAAKTGS